MYISWNGCDIKQLWYYSCFRSVLTGQSNIDYFIKIFLFYICIFPPYISYTREHMEDFTDSTGYDGRQGNLNMDMLDSEMVVSDEENGYGFEDSRKETC